MLLDLKAPLRTAQRRFPEAIKLLDRAVELFLHGEHRDTHLAGRSLVSKAGALIEMGDSASAVRTLKKAASLIQPERDPRLVLCIRHNLQTNLSKMGRHTERPTSCRSSGSWLQPMGERWTTSACDGSRAAWLPA